MWSSDLAFPAAKDISINDHFRKIVIVGDDIHRKEDELGVFTISIWDFLTDKTLLENG